MNNKIFFSYSWKDIPIAMRIYDDLKRNGIQLWRDEFSAAVGKGYKAEIEHALKVAPGIILLDGPNSRQSRYVQEECEMLSSETEWMNGRKIIAICLIADQAGTHAIKELFKGQNGYKFIDFSNCGELFDNDKNYLRAITALCELFGVVFHSAYPDTTEKDFEDELSKSYIKDIERTILLKEYELIQLRLANGFPNTLFRLEAFNSECKYMKLNCPSPMLQLGIELVKSGQYEKAKYLLYTYSELYCDDPRGWRVLARVLFELEEFNQALIAYDKTIALSIEVKKMKTEGTGIPMRFGSAKILDYLVLSKVNRAETLFQLNRYQETINEYEAILTDEENQTWLLPEFYLALINACDELNLDEKRKKWINAGLQKYPGNYQLMLAKARFLFETGELYQSAIYFGYLVNRGLRDIKVVAEYLSVLKTINSSDEFTKAWNSAIAIEPISECELYYYGYILFLNDKIDEAKYYYEKGTCEELPWYGKLWKN
ncbi:MAG: TIR domain-containing protein [Ferruginibacter sp.]